MSILNSHKKNLFPEDFFDSKKETTNESKVKHPQIITKENIKKKCVITCSEIKEEIEESLTESHDIHEEPSTSNSSNNNNIVLTPVSKSKKMNNRYENCENVPEKIFLFPNFEDDFNNEESNFKKTAHFFENNNSNNNNFNNININNNINKLINNIDVNNNNNINNNVYKDNFNIKTTFNNNNSKTPIINKKKISIYNNYNNNNNNKITYNKNNLTKNIPHPITVSTPRNNKNININNNKEKVTPKKLLEKKNSFNNLPINKRPKSSKPIFKININNNNKNEQNQKIKLTHKRVENEFNNVLTKIPKELLSDPEVKDKFNKIIKNINELKKVVLDKKVKI